VVLQGVIRFRRDNIAYREVIAIGYSSLIPFKRVRGEFLRLARQKPQDNRGVKSECHGSFPMMTRDALANGVHVVRKRLVDLDASEPGRLVRPSAAGRTAALVRLRIAEPLRIKN
jgi:hypothetical protein